jgi:hypothetical protein
MRETAETDRSMLKYDMKTLACAGPRRGGGHVPDRDPNGHLLATLAIQAAVAGRRRLTA